MNIVKYRHQEISRISLEQTPMNALRISSKSKIIKKANHKTSNISEAIDEIDKSSVKSSTD